VNNSFGKILVLLVFAAIIFGCANVSNPTGGPKDVEPPIIEKEVPAKGALNFDKNKIRVYFDEYVKIKDLNSQFISSPPLNKPPKAVLKGKSVVFSFEDTLLENTTYNLNFGNAIVDVNESNAFVNYFFAFSTGDYIDSLQVSGTLINASDLKPVEDVLILLYDNEIFYDSIPYFDLPSYIGKTNSAGRFNISYMRGGEFKIFALKDLNKNRIFDQPNENIAFLDSLILPEANIEIHTDTIKIDSLGTDSIVTHEIITYTPDSIQLFLFEEENHKQYLKGFNRDKKEQFVFIFNEKLDTNYKITGLDTNLSESIYYEPSVTGDTLNVWLTDSNLYNIDTIKVQFDYMATDTLDKLTMLNDTIKLIYKTTNFGKKKKKKSEIIEVKKPQIIVDFNAKSDTKLGLNKKLSFETNVPVNDVDKDRIHLFVKIKDEFVPIDFTLQQDSVFKRKHYLNFEIKEETDYKLLIDTNIFSNNYGLLNDTIINTFSSQALAYYGKILLSVENVNQSVIVQLISASDVVLQEFFINENKTITIEYLPAKTYKLKLIYDDNNNKKWDTGKYLEAKQPEKVQFYKENITVRANWDIELVWDILE